MRKGQISWTALVTILLAVMVLVTAVLFFTGYFEQGSEGIEGMSQDEYNTAVSSCTIACNNAKSTGSAEGFFSLYCSKEFLEGTKCWHFEEGKCDNQYNFRCNNICTGKPTGGCSDLSGVASQPSCESISGCKYNEDTNKCYGIFSCSALKSSDQCRLAYSLGCKWLDGNGEVAA